MYFFITNPLQRHSSRNPFGSSCYLSIINLLDVIEALSVFIDEDIINDMMKIVLFIMCVSVSPGQLSSDLQCLTTQAVWLQLRHVQGLQAEVEPQQMSCLNNNPLFAIEGLPVA